MRKKRRNQAKAALFGMALAVLGTPDVVPAKTAAKPDTFRGANRGRPHVTYASWYGWDFARRPTASGELFNPLDLTAAHRTLPLGTKVRVTNLVNGRSVVVRITDRGPYCAGRGIDLSREAARRLRMVNQGVAKVTIEPVPSVEDVAPVATAVAAWPSGRDGVRAVSS